MLLQTATNASTEEIMAIVNLYGGELLPGFYEDWIIIRSNL
jgi:hypothetical protein